MVMRTSRELAFRMAQPEFHGLALHGIMCSLAQGKRSSHVLNVLNTPRVLLK